MTVQICDCHACCHAGSAQRHMAPLSMCSFIPVCRRYLQLQTTHQQHDVVSIVDRMLRLRTWPSSIVN